MRTLGTIEGSKARRLPSRHLGPKVPDIQNCVAAGHDCIREGDCILSRRSVFALQQKTIYPECCHWGMSDPGMLSCDAMTKSPLALLPHSRLPAWS